MFEPYISSNTCFKTIAKIDFKKDNNELLKIENLEKRLKILEKKTRNRHTYSISYIDVSFISHPFQLIEKDKRSKINMNKPIFIGESTLDLSEIIDVSL